MYHVNFYFRETEKTLAIFQYKQSLKEKKRTHKRLCYKKNFF